LSSVLFACPSCSLSIRCADDLLLIPLSVGSSSLYPILVLEYFDGPSLSAHLAQSCNAEGVGLDEFRVIASSLSTIVGAIHSHQYIHRDITVANVLYQPKTGEVRLIDFGIATTFPGNNPYAHASKQLQVCTQSKGVEAAPDGARASERADGFTLMSAAPSR
jgi:serine/threonine protein kinase